jgi:hypothetical protein
MTIRTILKGLNQMAEFAEVEKTTLAVVLSVLDAADGDDCTERVRSLLDHDPHLAAVVAHDLAHRLINSYDAKDRAQIGQDLRAELLRLGANG